MPFSPLLHQSLPRPAPSCSTLSHFAITIILTAYPTPIVITIQLSSITAIATQPSPVTTQPTSVISLAAISASTTAAS